MIKKRILIRFSYIIAFFLIIFFLMKAIDFEANNPRYKNKVWEFSLNTFLKLPDPIKSLSMIVTGRRSYSNLFNDYNVKFLPETQLIKLDFQRKKTNFENTSNSSFYIEVNEEKIFITNKFGEFFTANIEDLVNENKINFKKLITKNLFEVNGELLDTLIINEKIYITKKSNYEKCQKLEIYEAKIDLILDFKIFKSFDECANIGVSAGRIVNYQFEGKEGILITTNDSGNDLPGKKAQDDNSIFGKIVFIENENKRHTIISKGHRNAQGLFVKDELILSTEHGPKGGDEINRILFGKNYGWPIASYGKAYASKELKYLKSHKENRFEEPLYVFMPSIGISELIILPNSFNTNWNNNLLVTSLNGRSIYRIKFEDEKYDKILYHEKIFIGERMRDIKYVDKLKLILVALERTGDIGIIQNKKIKTN